VKHITKNALLLGLAALAATGSILAMAISKPIILFEFSTSRALYNISVSHGCLDFVRTAGDHDESVDFPLLAIAAASFIFIFAILRYKSRAPSGHSFEVLQKNPSQVIAANQNGVPHSGQRSELERRS